MIRRALLALVLLAGVAPAFGQVPPPIPALPDVERRTTYSITASLCSCGVGFQLYGDSTDVGNWLEVFVGGVKIIQSGNWNITSPANPAGLANAPRPITDAVLTFTNAQTGTVQIVGARRPRRASQFTTQPSARDFNQVLTDIIAQNRENWDKTNDVSGRVPQAPPGETMALLPVLASRANMGACFDSGGNLTSCVAAAGSFAAGNGILFTGTNPTTISNNIQAGPGISLSGTNPIIISANSNAVNSVSANYPATSADCGKTIAAGGNAQFTITLSAAVNYGACSIDISNVDTWTSGRGKILSVNGLATNPPVLYPGQTVTLLNVNNAWFQKPGVALSQAPVGTRLYVASADQGGLDTNDCLAVAAPCQTLQHVVMQVIWQNLLATAGSGTGANAGFDIRLITDPACVRTTGVNCIQGLHYSGTPKQVEGHNSIMIECDAGSATNCTIADAGGAQAIGVYCHCFLELQNVGLAGGSGNNNALQVEKGMVRIQGNGVIAYTTTGNPQLSALDGGTIFVEGGALLNVSGGGAYLAQSTRGGIISLDQGSIKWLANSTYSSATLNAGSFSLIAATGASWQPNGFTITAPNNIACGPGGVVATGGTIASVPGTNTQLGCTASGNGQVN